MIKEDTNMYAILATGGKQYKVAEGDIIKVEKLNATEGAEVSFDVVAVSTDSDVICGEACKKSSVKATVLGEGKHKKVVVYKYKRKTGYHKKQGHRQPYTQVKIEAINA
jgi:large subunit ribosomal protein L21